MARRSARVKAKQENWIIAEEEEPKEQEMVMIRTLKPEEIDKPIDTAKGEAKETGLITDQQPVPTLKDEKPSGMITQAISMSRACSEKKPCSNLISSCKNLCFLHFHSFLTDQLTKKDKYGSTALHEAVQSGSLEMVEILLDKGARINAPNSKSNGETPLFLAVTNNHDMMVQLLLEKGANPDTTSTRGYGTNALMYACEHGYTDIVRILIAHEADIELENPYEWTPIMEAAMHGQSETVQVLLEANCNVFAENGFRETTLMKAARSGDLRTVQVVMEAIENQQPSCSAHINQTNKYDRSALAWAANLGHGEIITYLREHGAIVTTHVTRNAKGGMSTFLKAKMERVSEVEEEEEEDRSGWRDQLFDMGFGEAYDLPYDEPRGRWRGRGGRRKRKKYASVRRLSNGNFIKR